MIRKLLHTTALWLEHAFDLVRPARGEGRLIEPYAGYASDDQLVVRGRVLSAIRRHKPKPDQSKFTNFQQMLSLFLTREVADVPVRSGDVEAISDEEGYFTLILPKPDKTGWIDVPVHIGDSAQETLCPAFIAGDAAEFITISDIDDTLIETGAYSLLRNLWTSFTGNVRTRHVYPDAVKLISDLSGAGRNPVFYVSSSPWNLYVFLSQIFERAGLVKGPMFLRDLGLSETKFITDGHGNHKGGSIDTVLNGLSDLPVILMGDTGQHDAEIYAKVVERYDPRVKVVILREAKDGLDAEDARHIAHLEAVGVTVFHGPNFPEVSQVLAAVRAGPSNADKKRDHPKG